MKPKPSAIPPVRPAHRVERRIIAGLAVDRAPEALLAFLDKAGGLDDDAAAFKG